MIIFLDRSMKCSFVSFLYTPVSYRNLCTRSTELATTFNEIKNSTGTNPVCIATAKAYAIAAPLPGDAAQVACVDSAGMNGQVSALPTKAVCE
jgi:hypothetical protein